jgi:hypothetical protein
VAVQITGKPMLQYFCHCDDCQAVHGKAYACSVYPAAAVSVVGGETDVLTLRTSPRIKCKQCGTYLFAEVPGQSVRGVNADLLPVEMFKPEFHSQCRYAAAPIQDDLPHYKGIPARFRGSDELMEW